MATASNSCAVRQSSSAAAERSKPRVRARQGLRWLTRGRAVPTPGVLCSGRPPGKPTCLRIMASAASDSRQRKNFRMIQKFVPGAVEIAEQSLFVAVYTFNEAEQSWEREDIEGPLFIVQRNADADQPESFALAVVNRNSSTNLLLFIGSSFEYDVNGEYLMFRCAKGVYGLWFPDASDRSRIVQRLDAISSSQEKNGNARALANGEAGAAPSRDAEVSSLLQKMLVSEKAREAAAAAAVENEETAPASFSGPQASSNFILSKEQMKEVLLRLVQTDKFVDILHSTYLKSQGAKVRQLPAQQQQQPQPQMLHAHPSLQHGDANLRVQHHDPQSFASHSGHLQHHHQHNPMAPSPLRQPQHMYGMPPPQVYNAQMMPPQQHQMQGAPMQPQMYGQRPSPPQ